MSTEKNMPTMPNLHKENMLNKDQNDNNMEKVIHNLRSAYTEMKKERLKTEKDLEHLEHKLKMFQTEELKAYKKFTNEKKFKEEWEYARHQTQEFRKFLNDAKTKKKQETDGVSKKIKETREYIQRSINVKKMMKFQENRLNNLQLKQKKIENCELRRSMIKDENTKNKRMAESVKNREKTITKMRKLIEDEKKNKVKRDLEDKLLEEQRKKKIFESKLSSLEELETGLLKRMKNSDDHSLEKESKYRSVSAVENYSSRKKANYNSNPIKAK